MPDAISLQNNRKAAWKSPFSRAECARLLRAMLDEAERPGMAVELALLDDAAMEELNAASMGCAGPTNILSFPAGNAPGEGAAPGCLALSTDTLLRECFLYGQEADEHCIRLLAHGLSHLTGLDHGPEMEALSDRLERAARAALRRSAGETPPQLGASF
jgi:probable rRNA maturation factor